MSSSGTGTAIEAKVAKYILDQGEEVVLFRSDVSIISNNKVVSTAGDIDVATSEQLIEVKASIASAKPDQIKKYVDSCNEKFFNFEGKKVIIYIDKPIDMSNVNNIRKIEELERLGVTIVNSLEELREVIK